jgi:hypothetical protein
VVHNGFDDDGVFFLHCGADQVVVSFWVEFVDPAVGLVFPLLLSGFNQVLKGV